VRRPILIAYDGSPGAQAAALAASELLPGAHAVVLHVYAQAITSGEATAGTTPDPALNRFGELDRIEHARGVAAEGAGLAARLGFQAEPEIAEGAGDTQAATVILESARERDAAVIVIGARGHSWPMAVVLGSVCDRVVHRSDRPVLVGPARLAQEPASERRS